MQVRRPIFPPIRDRPKNKNNLCTQKVILGGSCTLLRVSRKRLHHPERLEASFTRTSEQKEGGSKSIEPPNSQRMNFFRAAMPAIPQDIKRAELPASGEVWGGGPPAKELAATMNAARATRPRDNLVFFIKNGSDSICVYFV
jgi:hypothetical protein